MHLRTERARARGRHIRVRPAGPHSESRPDSLLGPGWRGRGLLLRAWAGRALPVPLSTETEWQRRQVRTRDSALCGVAGPPDRVQRGRSVGARTFILNTLERRVVQSRRRACPAGASWRGGAAPGAGPSRRDRSARSDAGAAGDSGPGPQQCTGDHHRWRGGYLPLAPGVAEGQLPTACGV
jgi:hypothetical protein